MEDSASGSITPKKEVIQVISHSTFLGKEVDVYGSAERPLFLAKDVASWIEHSSPSKMIESIDTNEKISIFCKKPALTNSLKPCISRTYNGANRLFLTEDGLYEVLMQSRKPLAKQFKKGVKEILKTIRKTGSYQAHPSKLPDFTNPAEAARAWAEQYEIASKSQKRIEAAEHYFEEQKPRIDFANAVEASTNSCLISELAKILTQYGYETGERRLFQWMRDNGYLCRVGDYYNHPTQKAMEKGLFEIKKIIIHLSGGDITRTTVKVTGKGQLYFFHKFIDSVLIKNRSYGNASR